MAVGGFAHLRERTRRFALDVIQLTEAIPRSREGDVIARQLIRSGTSVAANYRSACRARSRPDFVAKMGVVEEEADETQFWLELLQQAGLMTTDRTEPLAREADELVAIAVASRKRARMP